VNNGGGKDILVFDQSNQICRYRLELATRRLSRVLEFPVFLFYVMGLPQTGEIITLSYTLYCLNCLYIEDNVMFKCGEGC